MGQWQLPLSLEKGMSHFPNGQSMAMLDMCVFDSDFIELLVLHFQDSADCFYCALQGY